MQDAPALTERQQQILNLVREAIERSGAPPTRAEIAAAMGFKSANAAEEHLQALARKGAIELVGGTSRGIRLPAQALRAIARARGGRSDGLHDGHRPADAVPPHQFMLPLAGIAQLSLPLIGRVAAGSPLLAQEHVDRTFAIEAGLFARRPDYLLKVRGMSMRDAGILDGDLLAVQKTREARNGQIIVARLADEVTVKRFRRTRAGGIELLPENPEFLPIVVPPGEAAGFEIEGLAVGLIRNTVLN